MSDQDLSAGAVSPTHISLALVHLAGGQPVHVDERCRRGLDDDLADPDADLGRIGADRRHAAGVPARPAQRRCYFYSSSYVISVSYTSLIYNCSINYNWQIPFLKEFCFS